MIKASVAAGVGGILCAGQTELPTVTSQKKLDCFSQCAGSSGPPAVQSRQRSRPGNAAAVNRADAALVLGEGRRSRDPTCPASE